MPRPSLSVPSRVTHSGPFRARTRTTFRRMRKNGRMSNSDLRHRLVAILAADGVGYSRLMSIDDQATVVALDSARAVFRDEIEANQGRVIDMAGDSVLAVFETATGAVQAALSVQNQLSSSAVDKPEDLRMRFRIGVHLGDSIEKADGTVYGDGVNIAARLQGLAEPGGITVSESIRTAVKGKVCASFDDLGEQAVKNIADPVRPWRVRGDSGVDGVGAVSAVAFSQPGLRQSSTCLCPTSRRSQCCPSPTCPATRSRSTSPTASPKTSSPSCRAFIHSS